MRKIIVFLTVIFFVFFITKNLSAQPRYAVCDLCGYCPPQPAPQSWDSCRNCLYPGISSDPTTKESILIDPVSNSAPTTVPGKQYTYLGCIGEGTSFAEEGVGAGVIQPILNILFSAVGGIAFLFLLYGIAVVTTSQADPGKLNYGKRIIYGAIIGLIFSLSSVLIVKTIFSNILKIPISSSNFPTSVPHPTNPNQFQLTPIPTSTSTPTSGPTITPGGPTLTPTPTPVTSACSVMDNDLPNSTMRYPDGYTGTPATTKQIFNFAGNNNYSIPYRNPNCSLSQTIINNVYEKMKSFYPYYWQQSKLLEDWETVQSYAIKYNFNPVFVIALWVEESAAGGATNAQKLGCVYRLNKDNTFTHMLPSSTICEQMECLFGRWSVYPQNYALFGCQYQFGSDHWVNNQCTDNPEFVKTIEFWYDFMSSGQPTECRAKYCPNAPGC